MNPSPAQLQRIRDLTQQLHNELADLQSVLSMPDVAIPARLPFSWPCGDITRRTLAPWFDATGYAALYSNGTAYHTGNDLNLSAYGDSGAEVYACADGVVVYAGVWKGWQQSMIVVMHTLEDGRLMWSRYAHIALLPGGLKYGDTVKRGDLLGHIADYAPKGPQGDHLHFDLAWVDLGAKPGDWPGLDQRRVLADYVDGCKWISERLP